MGSGDLPAVERIDAALRRATAPGHSLVGSSVLTLGRSGEQAGVVHLENWRGQAGAEAGQRSRNYKRVSESLIVHMPFPDLLGIAGRFAVRPKAGGGVGGSTLFGGESEVVQALLDRGLGAVIEQGPLGDERDPEIGVALRGFCGQLVADTASGRTGDDALGHLAEILDDSVLRIRSWIAETRPDRPPLDAVKSPSMLPQEIAAGATDLGDARDRLLDSAPRGFLFKKRPKEAQVLNGFGQSYAAARGFHGELGSSAKELLPRWGIPYTETPVSALGELGDGRPVRVAHVLHPVWGPKEQKGVRRVRREPRDVAIAELSAAEVTALAGSLPAGARLAGVYLIVEVPAEEITAAGLDAARAEAERLVASV